MVKRVKRCGGDGGPTRRARRDPRAAGDPMSPANHGVATLSFSTASIPAAVTAFEADAKAVMADVVVVASSLTGALELAAAGLESDRICRPGGGRKALLVSDWLSGNTPPSSRIRLCSS